jgi:hypothetical protein
MAMSRLSTDSTINDVRMTILSSEYLTSHALLAGTVGGWRQLPWDAGACQRKENQKQRAK